MATWLDYMFNSDSRQRWELEALRVQSRASARADRRRGRKLEDNAEQIEDLKNQVGELALVCKALMATLEAAEITSPDAFAETLRRIDAEDGVIDGRVTPQAPPPPPPPKAPKQRRKRR